MLYNMSTSQGGSEKMKLPWQSGVWKFQTEGIGWVNMPKHKLL